MEQKMCCFCFHVLTTCWVRDKTIWQEMIECNWVLRPPAAGSLLTLHFVLCCTSCDTPAIHVIMTSMNAEQCSEFVLMPNLSVALSAMKRLRGVSWVETYFQLVIEICFYSYRTDNVCRFSQRLHLRRNRSLQLTMRSLGSQTPYDLSRMRCSFVHRVFLGRGTVFAPKSTFHWGLG